MSPTPREPLAPATFPSAAWLFTRLGDPLAWSDATKCLFVASSFLTFTLWYDVLFLYLQRHAEVAPYIDRHFLRWFIEVLTLGAVVWAIVIVTCLVQQRRRRGRSPVVVALTMVLCALQLVHSTYLFGLHTSLYSGLILIASWAIGLALFDKRAMKWATTVVMSVLLALTIGEQVGLIPYAPLIRGTPVHEGHLHHSWLLGVGGVTLVMMGVVFFLLYFVIERWHDREAKLALARQRIEDADNIIGRYIPNQLAEQIRSGDYTSLEHPERRRLTVFYSDIENFEETADRMEPEDLSAQLSDYLCEMTAIAERHGATIDKFVGGAMMIFLGAPMASSDRDHALRAVRMAIEMQDRLRALREQWSAQGTERPFHVRIGISTGQASVGTFGSWTRLEYTAIGRQVNLAALLQPQCGRDRILISHATWALIHDEIACTPKGKITLKGFHKPLEVYEVDQPVSARGPGSESPLRAVAAGSG